MTASEFLDRFDLDITLHDASLDPENPPTRRMIANAAIGLEPLDAYYAVREVREAVEWTHEGRAEGKGKLASILSNLRANVRLLPLLNPYIAAEPDGPLVESHGDFAQGSSWWAERSLRL